MKQLRKLQRETAAEAAEEVSDEEPAPSATRLMLECTWPPFINWGSFIGRYRAPLKGFWS